MTQPSTGTAAGVPYVLVPPATLRPNAPVVLAWHLMDAPRTERAFAAALPLDTLDAWRLYLGLPMTGTRSPGAEELQRRGMDDAVLRIYGPVAEQALREVRPVLSELRPTVGDGPLALVGGSMGAAVAQLVLAEAGLEVAVVVLISPLVQLRPLVTAAAATYGFTYSWTPESDAVADRLDFVARAAELGAPVLAVVGAEDEQHFHTSAAALVAALDGAELVVVDGMGHALAEEPGLEPAPQTPHAAQVDRATVAWLREHLPPGA